MFPELSELFTIPFFWGLLAGVVLMAFVTAYLYFTQYMRRRSLHKELRQTREHLHTQMTISNKGQEEQQRDLVKLKEQNENMRITINTLQQKPGREELRTLQSYDRALRIMNGRAPGFYPAWERALSEAEEEITNVEKGVGGFLRRTFSGGGSKNHALPAGKSKNTNTAGDDIEAAIAGEV